VHRTALGGLGGPALPFEPAGEIAAMVAGLPPEVQARMAARLAELGDLSRVAVSGTVLPFAATTPVLPFEDAEVGSAAPDTVPPPPAEGEDDPGDEVDTHRPPPWPSAVSMPVHGLGAPRAPSGVSTPDHGAAPGGVVIPAAWAAEGFSVKETMVLPDAAPPVAEMPAPEPPAMIGPLAKAAPVASEAPPPAEAGEPAPAGAPEPPAPAQERLELDDYPIERQARIAASVDLHEAERARVLSENGLSEATWERLRKHRNTVISSEAARGKSTTMRAYDAAYIARIEAERGPVEIAEYARIAVAMDRGAADEALAGMGLPRGAAMPLRRAWTARMFKDVKLAALVRRAIAEERER
jgi:hypothetical protein